MVIATLALLVEFSSITYGFTALSQDCPIAMIDGSAEVSSDCIWSGVYQFHSVYLSFVHIMFFVLLNCCVSDAVRVANRGEGSLDLYMNWHNFTALPFPALFANMLSIVLMQKYVALFSTVTEWNGFVMDAFWLVLKGLAVGNILFNLIIFCWFFQSHRELSLLQSLLSRVPFIGSRYASAMVDASVDVEKAVPIVAESDDSSHV
ncbi:hypothetical protein HDU98_002992 [Podochytrium sp. JEL0797]|nr:hypothetical protein HDU98_002992 [Podochytrium sp. JEL0797]